MGALVQKMVVEDPSKASPLLPQRVALVNPDGTPFSGGGASPGAATTSKAGLVKMAAAVSQVSAADAAQAAGDAPTKAEFDAVVALANSLKATLNQLLSAETSAGQMGS